MKGRTSLAVVPQIKNGKRRDDMNQAGSLLALLRLVPHGHLVFFLILCSSLGSWLSFPFSFQPANGQEKPETSLFRFLMGARLLFWRQEPDEVSVAL